MNFPLKTVLVVTWVIVCLALIPRIVRATAEFFRRVATVAESHVDIKAPAVCMGELDTKHHSPVTHCHHFSLLSSVINHHLALPPACVWSHGGGVRGVVGVVGGGHGGGG